MRKTHGLPEEGPWRTAPEERGVQENSDSRAL